jgi:hypothetical protein
MEETILVTIKRNMSGITPENHDFDLEILDHINTYLRFCNRFGIGVESFCADANSVWSDFLGDDVNYYSAVKDYITLKIKHWWDPPTVGAAVNAIEEAIKQIEFDLMIRRECPESFGYVEPNDEPDDPYEDW